MVEISPFAALPENAIMPTLMKASFHKSGHYHICRLRRRTYFVFIRFLFPDAEISEDVAEDFVGRDLADDGTEVVDGFADVLGGEVGW